MMILDLIVCLPKELNILVAPNKQPDKQLEIIQQVRHMLLNNRKVNVLEIAEIMGISTESVVSILHEQNWPKRITKQ